MDLLLTSGTHKLNSNTCFKELNSNMDLNNLTEYRFYRTTSGSIVKTLKNIPANISVDGEVLIIWLPFITNSSFGCQILFSTYSCAESVYLRNRNNNSWSAWKEFTLS